MKNEPAARPESNQEHRIGMGYYYLPESVYHYLEDALSSLCDVDYFGTPYKGRPGFLLMTIFSTLLRTEGAAIAG